MSRISVIIPVRNEAKHILQLLEDLAAQSFPATHFEVSIINDSSTDPTREIVESYIPNAPYSLQIHDLSPQQKRSHKKAAITLGIQKTKGELIVTTDGDCRVGRNWLRDLHGLYQEKQPKLISGGVTFHQEQSFFEKLQTVEFSSLIGSGASSMAWKAPNMCNGANLAYPRSVFEEVDGFKGFEHITSGDDEFLMHKIHALYPDKVLFLKSRAALVKTAAQTSLKSFYHQRKRWASKWHAYQNWKAVAAALFVFLFHFLYVSLFLACLMGWLPWLPLIICFSFRLGIEVIFLSLVLDFLNQRSRIILIPLVAFFYSFYVSIIAIAALKGNYIWKDRNVNL